MRAFWMLVGLLIGLRWPGEQAFDVLMSLMVGLRLLLREV